MLQEHFGLFLDTVYDCELLIFSYFVIHFAYQMRRNSVCLIFVKCTSTQAKILVNYRSTKDYRSDQPEI